MGVADASTGGAFSSARPKITSLQCLAACSGFESVKQGSVLRVRGKAMGQVRRIVFLAGKGSRDDVRAATLKRSERFVDVLVPAKASSGHLRAINSDGLRSRVSKPTVTVKARSSGSLDARVVARYVYQGASRQAQLDVLAHKPLNVTVLLTRIDDGAVMQTWQLGPLIPGVVRSVMWDGTLGGFTQPIGRYEFRVTATATGYQPASAGAPAATEAFDLVDHKFPVRARHSYGQGVARYGAGRAGHTHQGQDVFAKCGTTLVAARGGVVKLNKFQSRAGNYLIIDGAATAIDYAYMHLQKRSPLKKGARVVTGQTIGRVGDTGDAQGCHLHFEMWSGPGWYTGGHPFDPMPFLKAWDKYS